MQGRVKIKPREDKQIRLYIDRIIFFRYTVVHVNTILIWHHPISRNHRNTLDGPTICSAYKNVLNYYHNDWPKKKRESKQTNKIKIWEIHIVPLSCLTSI